ncbi:MAG TPA: transglycosylase SLT domain-containing protein, partial [Longimicrobiaceae bacterium]
MFGDIRDDFPVDHIERVTPEFVQEVVEMGGRLNLEPLHLLAIMSFESGLKPDAVNPQSKATGLIQFLRSTAKDLGTTTAALKEMSAVEQLEFVEKYFKQFKKKFATHNTLEDAYMAVLFPAAIGKGADHVLFRKGTTAYEQNKGLDI